MNSFNTCTAILGALLLAVSTHTLAGKSSDAYFVRADPDTTTQNSSKDAATGLPTGKRQHKPMTAIKPLDKATPNAAAQVKKIPGMHKTGDITLKRGIVD